MTHNQNNNPFDVLRPSTLAAIIADIDANQELVAGDRMTESVREACYQALVENQGHARADYLVAEAAKEF